MIQRDMSGQYITCKQYDSSNIAATNEASYSLLIPVFLTSTSIKGPELQT